MREYLDTHVVFEDCKILKVTDKGGVLCEIEDNKIWIPQSQIHEDSEVWLEGQEGDLIISRWIAEKKGLV